MGLSFSTSGGSQSFGGTSPLALTITIPANSAVGLLAALDGASGMGYFAGAVTDTGGNTYTSAGGAGGPGADPSYYCDAFYCLNTGSSATSITYTPSASYPSGNVYSMGFVAWVWTVSGGTATFGSQANNPQTSPVGTGTDAITSTSVTCSTGSVVMGLTNVQGTGPVSVGTGFTLDFDAFSTTIGEHGAFSSNQAATWTTATGADGPIGSQAMSFGFAVTTTAIRQACVAYSGTSTVSSESATFAEATLAGSTIYVVATGNITAVPMGFSDVVNGSYQRLTSDNITDGTASQALAAFVFPNAAAISAAQNLTVSPATSVKNLGFVAYEISGGASINQLVGHASNLQTIATNVANGIASPAINCGIGSALLVGVCMNTTANGVTYLPVTGGAFTAAPSPGAAFWPYLTLNLAAGEYQTVSGGGVNSVYFTAPTSTSNDYVTFAAAFNQLALPLLGQILM